MALIKFLKSKTFLINLVIAFILFLVGVWFFFRMLDIYTHHGESMTVPDMTGQSVEEVIETIESRGLRYQINDSVYHPDMPVNTVVEHNPPPYAQVKRDRRIYLTINSGDPPMTKVPDIVDVSRRQAERILESRGLRVGALIYEPDIARDVILELRQDGETLEPGDEVPQGSAIDMVLGDGLAGATVTVPNLNGLTLQEAMFVLNVRGLNLGAVSYTDEEHETEDAIIFRQSPEPGTEGEEVEISHGESINIYLTSPEQYEQNREDAADPPEELEELNNRDNGNIDF